MGEIHIRTRTGAESLLASDLRRIVRELDPTLNVYDIRTMNEHVEKNAMLRRIPAQMFVVLGPLLLVLAAIGIYAVVAYSVAQRTAEIGVRLALGATARQVVGQIVGETLRVVYVGAMTGLLIAFIIDIHVARGAIYLPAFVGVPVDLDVGRNGRLLDTSPPRQSGRPDGRTQARVRRFLAYDRPRGEMARLLGR